MAVPGGKERGQQGSLALPSLPSLECRVLSTLGCCDLACAWGQSRAPGWPSSTMGTGWEDESDVEI